MNEAETIARASVPGTRDSLAADLRALGVQPGMCLLLHSSLSALGWVSGGPVAVVQALMDVLTPRGTLVTPAFSGDLSDPGLWIAPPVPPDWVPVVRASMPAYDPRVTPTRQMGRIVETFRRFPGVIRSAHPSSSFAAWGRHARRITRNHALEFALGEASPLARLYDLDGHVLLLGVSYGNNTSFHLAEARCARPPVVTQGAPVMENGERIWKEYRDFDYDDDDFPQIGADFEATGAVRVARVACAEARLFAQRPAVDFALAWMRAKSTAA